MPEVGEWGWKRGKWTVTAPTHCANGHPLVGGQVLVGTVACDCDTRHMTWWCKTCAHTTYGPALGDRCRVRTGPDER